MTDHLQADITVAIPTIPTRHQRFRARPPLLTRALASVSSQELQPSGGTSVATDTLHDGAWITRQRALDGVKTKWVAFLDDDDYFHPQHLRVLYDLVTDHNADYAYSWMTGSVPFPKHRGRQFDHSDPHHTTITVLVRTELAKSVGFTGPPEDDPNVAGEDWRFILGCSQAGAKFIGTGEETWHYNSHGRNTSGLPTRW